MPDLSHTEASQIERYKRWLHDPAYHARVATVRRWMERSSGGAPVELLGYAMEAVDDLDRLEAARDPSRLVYEDSAGDFIRVHEDEVVLWGEKRDA